MGINKRRFRRARASNIAARVTCSNRTLTCTVENISFGGVFLRGPVLPLDSVVTLEIVRPGMKRMLSLKGRVVSIIQPREATERKLNPGVGVVFVDCTPEDRPRFLQLLHDLGVDENPLLVTEPQGSLPPILRPPSPATAPETAGPPPALSRMQPPASAPATATSSAPTLPGQNPGGAEVQRLMIQIQGLLTDLGAANAALARKDARIAQLQSELDQLRSGRH